MQKYAQIVTEHAENMVKKWSNPGSKTKDNKKTERHKDIQNKDIKTLRYKDICIDKGLALAREGSLSLYFFIF